jgi:putative ABC transport system permease protein
VLSLAIGIGANTALFSFVNAVLWRPLPYRNAERLVHIKWPAGVDFVAISETNRVFNGLAGWIDRSFTMTGRGPAVQLWAQRVTPELLSLLGVTPQAGRDFAAEEFQPGHDQVVIISDRVWRNRFSADPQIIGQTLFRRKGVSSYGLPPEAGITNFVISASLPVYQPSPSSPGTPG